MDKPTKRTTLGEVQTQELIVFGGEVQSGPVAGETCNDAPMFFAEPGRFKGLTKVLPSRGRVGGQTCTFRRRQRVNRSREGTNGFLDALIRRRQLELSVKRFEVMAEFFSKRQGMIGCGNSRFRHGGQKDDTGWTVVVTTDKQDAGTVTLLSRPTSARRDVAFPMYRSRIVHIPQLGPGRLTTRRRAQTWCSLFVAPCAPEGIPPGVTRCDLAERTF